MRKPQFQDYRSYDNMDPLEKGESDHVLRIDGKIKVQISTLCYLTDLSINAGEIRLKFRKGFFSAPTEWPIGTMVTLIYHDAKLVPSPLNPNVKIEDIKGVRSLEPFETTASEKRRGHKRGLELREDDGDIWDLLYDSALVEWKLPAHKGIVDIEGTELADVDLGAVHRLLDVARAHDRSESAQILATFLKDAYINTDELQRVLSELHYLVVPHFDQDHKLNEYWLHVDDDLVSPGGAL